jgi:hypothetical protein
MAHGAAVLLPSLGGGVLWAHNQAKTLHLLRSYRLATLALSAALLVAAVANSSSITFCH